MMRLWLAALALASLAPATARAAEHPLTLDEAVQLALSRNERAKVADEQVLEASAAVEKARVAFLPVVAATGTEVVRPYSVERNGTTVTPSNQSSTAATISQPLLNAPAWPLYRQAQRLLDAQQASSKDAKRILEFDAANAFLNALSLEAVLDAANRRLDTAKASLAYAQARVEGGLNSSNDVTRAQLDLASAAREVASDEGNVKRGYLALEFVINETIVPPLVAPAPTLAASAMAPGSVPQLVAAAEARRLDLVAAKHALRAAQLFADEPLLRLLPTVNVSGTVTAASLAYASGKNTDESATALLTWQIYDAGNRYADKKSRDAAYRIADLNALTLARSIATDVQTADAALSSAQGAYRASADAVTASRKSVDETSTLYRQGLATALELTDANDARFEAEVDYVGAEFAMALAYLALREAVGLEPLGTELK